MQNPIKAAHLLIVDDEKDIRNLMQEIFTEEGYEVRVAANGVQARDAWRDCVPDLIFLDIWMPDVDGISLLKEMQNEQLLEHSTVVIMSGHGTIETAIEATRLGAYDFMEKPLSLAKLMVTAERALEHNRLKHENTHLKQAQPGLVLPIGQSKLIREQRNTIERLAKYTMPILLIGEAGTGKQFFAQALHQSGNRQSAPFMTLHARELSDRLEYWLGRADEQANMVGQIEQVKGGTLVLTHLNQLSSAAQDCLADLIFHQAYRRIGCDKLHPIDLRLVCTCREPLDDFVSQGSFREDIYKRLNVLPIIIPALRQHTEDIPDLIDYFVTLFMRQEGLPKRDFPESIMPLLKQYPWPGNLRELRNLIQRLLILGGHAEVSDDEIKFYLAQSSQQYVNVPSVDTSVDLKTAKENFETLYLKQMLRETGGSVSETARRSGVERTHLYRKLKALDIDPKDPI
jgi:DNA-binding NtrC family response regulator